MVPAEDVGPTSQVPEAFGLRVSALQAAFGQVFQVGSYCPNCHAMMTSRSVPKGCMLSVRSVMIDVVKGVVVVVAVGRRILLWFLGPATGPTLAWCLAWVFQVEHVWRLRQWPWACLSLPRSLHTHSPPPQMTGGAIGAPTGLISLTRFLRRSQFLVQGPKSKVLISLIQRREPKGLRFERSNVPPAFAGAAPPPVFHFADEGKDEKKVLVPASYAHLMHFNWAILTSGATLPRLDGSCAPDWDFDNGWLSWIEIICSAQKHNASEVWPQHLARGGTELIGSAVLQLPLFCGALWKVPGVECLNVTSFVHARASGNAG